MADNVFKRIGKAIVNKSHGGTFPLTTHDTSSFKPFSSFWNWIMGKHTLRSYIDAYGRNPFVAMVVDRIAFTSASIKRIAVDKNDNDITDTSVILELIENPNPEQSQIEFLELMGKFYEATGNTFVRHIQGVGGVGNELRVLESDKVIINCNKINEVVSYDYTNPQGRILTIPVDEVEHIHESNIVNTDGKEAKYGLSKLHAAMIVVVSSDEKFKADASITKNKGAAGIVTTDSDTPMLPKERERMQDEFDFEKQGADKFGKTLVSSTKLRYLQMGMSPTDLKILEGLLSSMRIICSTYGLNSIIFNDTASSTFNNITEATKSSYLQVYIPTANKFDDKLSKFLSRRLRVEETIKVDLNSIEIIEAGTNEVLQALNSMPDRLSVIAIQSLTDDEIREMITVDALSDGQQTIGQVTQTPSNDGQTTN
jgi:HK97 family phage portal protein